MNYYYTFTNKFLRNFHSNLNQEQSYKVLSFIRENFFRSNIFFLKMNRKLLLNKFGESKVAPTFKEFKKQLSHQINDFYNSKNLPIDYCFVGDNEEEKKYGDKANYISCKKILKNSESLKNKIEMSYKDFWIGSHNNKSKKILLDILDRIFKSCDKIWIIDRYVAAVAINGEKYQIKGYKNTFNCYGSLIKKSGIDYLHISNLSEKQIENIQKISKEKYEDKFLDLCESIIQEQEKVLIKNKSHDVLHDRYLITFLGDEMFNMYDLNQGDLLRDKFTTINRKLKKMDPFEAEEEWPKLFKIVENLNNYAFISKSGFNYKNN